jgi:IclR family pca regulon transcriptional regulator
MSAPIRDRSGRAIAALNISGQVNRTPPAHMLEAFLPKLLEAADTISRLLQMKT